jgi:hypothetical protein
MINNSYSKRFAIASLFSMALVLMILACGGDGGETSNSGNAPGDNLPAAANAELECDVEGYPCSLAEVPAAIRERSQFLANEALAMIENGASMAEVRAWLNDQEGMVEIMSDDLALRFRLEGGRGTWVLRKEAVAEAPASEALSPLSDRSSRFVEGQNTQPKRDLVFAPTYADQGISTPAFVAGQNTKPKRALVLSPFYWDFADNQGGAQVAAILSSTRGYEGRVTYLFNETFVSRQVTISNFKSWQNYQVIHIDSHGNRICEAGSCRAVLLFTSLGATQGSTEEEKADLTSPGVEVVAIEEKVGAYLGLNADFFRAYYPGGLNDTLVFFNACESFGNQATDLADAIRGSTSVFLGWNGTVDVSDSNATSRKLFQELSLEGVTVKEAFTRLGDLQTDSRGVRLVRSMRASGGDLRIRDIVYLLNPDTRQTLDPSQEVKIVGEMDDDEPDTVPYLVQVDGIVPQNAANALLYVSVDGIVSEPKSVSEGETGDPDRWIVSGAVDLPYDVKQAMSVDFEAWVELPDGGESNHETSATLNGTLKEDGIVGIWVVDNASIEFTPQAFTLEYIQGEIRVTFRDDGNMEVVYNNHEYKESADRLLDVGGIDIERHEEFTYTANARGTTTYEVNGGEISFGSFFENSYVDGTQTVHHIRQFNPSNVIGADIDEVTERSYGGWGLFGGFVKFNLSPSGSTLELLNGDKITAILNRVGSAGG